MISYEKIDFYPIPNIEKYYISKCGKVLSTRSPSGKEKEGKEYRNVMKLNKVTNGYIRVRLYDCKQKTYAVHKLVALTFIGENKNLEIDHINQNKTDNHVNNLRYVTRSDNERNKLQFDGISCKNGKEVTCQFYTTPGNRHKRSFAINKYGFAFAFLLATNVRDEMVKKYYNRV